MSVFRVSVDASAKKVQNVHKENGVLMAFAQKYVMVMVIVCAENYVSMVTAKKDALLMLGAETMKFALRTNASKYRTNFGP